MRLPESVYVALRIWCDIAFVVFMMVTWPLRVIVRRAKRERWSDPR